MLVHFRSIISRIISLHVIAIGITSLCMPLALYLLLSSTATDLQHRALDDHANTIARYLVAGPNGTLSLRLPAGLDALYSESYGRYAYAVLDGDGRVLFSSLSNNTPIFQEDPRSPIPSFLETRRGDAPIYGASIPKHVGARTVWIQVAQDLAHRDVLIDDIVADFFPRVGWIILPILLLLLAIDIAIFHRALRPVLKASETAQTISPVRTEVRLPTADIPTEILPLVGAINQALERLEHGFRTQREFTADAAHELRTPLAVLRARIDDLADEPVRDTLRQDIAGMSRIVSQLLDIAELESLIVEPAEVADLHGVCADVVSFMAPLALAEGKSIALTGATGPVWIKGNAETVFQAIRNLTENAIHHTPAATTVEIAVTEHGMARVLDDGPGIPESERDVIFRRFWRRDRRRTGSAGLGLSIVSRIVEAHAGSIAVENRPAGGASFELRFKLAEDARSVSEGPPESA